MIGISLNRAEPRIFEVVLFYNYRFKNIKILFNGNYVSFTINLMFLPESSDKILAHHVPYFCRIMAFISVLQDALRPFFEEYLASVISGDEEDLKIVFKK